jgi:hypothetical protein
MYDYSNLIAAVVGLIVMGGCLWGIARWDRRNKKARAEYEESLHDNAEFQREYLATARESQRLQAELNAALQELLSALLRDKR